MVTRDCTRPIMRWHGGKWRLAPWIISHLPDHKTYVEPFAGASSVLLRKHRSYAEVLNDLDGEVVNLFRVARDHGGALEEAVRMTPFSREEFDRSYQPVEDPVEQARRTLVRSWMGFGSNAHSQKTGFRSNVRRSGTTPAGDWMEFPVALRSIIERLRGVVIENRDAISVLRSHDSNDTCFYVDPPYMRGVRSGCAGYRHELSDDDHRSLLGTLVEIKGKVLLSGYATDLYSEFLCGWTQLRCETMADGAKPRVETLWLSPSCTPAGLFGGDCEGVRHG